MRPRVDLCLVVTTVLACAAGTLHAEDAPFASHVKPFLTTYCVSCHGGEKQKGDRRFDQLTGEITDDGTLVDLQDVVDQLNLGEMPPKKSPQPKDEERRKVVGWLTTQIGQYHEQRKATSSAASLRRLNAREYRNSIRDLLHFNTSMFDPTVGFPSDNTTQHLDNIAETLVTSGHLLERYLSAADRIVEKALTPAQKPEPRVWRFTEGFRQQPEID